MGPFSLRPRLGLPLAEMPRVSAAALGRRDAVRRPLHETGRVTTVITILLVIVPVLMLTVLPVLVQRRIDWVLNTISDTVDPSREALEDVQLAFALEVAGTRGFLLTGDERYAKRHHEARAARKRAFAKFAELSRHLRLETRPAVADIKRTLDAADGLLDALYGSTITREQYLAILPHQQARFEAVTTATTQLAEAVNEHARSLREQVRTIHGVDALLTIVGTLLALGAIVSITRLSRKYLAVADRERAARDASERAQAEAERRRQELHRLSASHDALIRGFSHDLKNPLGAADGYLFMLEEGVVGPLTTRQKDCVAKTRRSVARAIRLIADLLELARAESGQLALHQMPMDLRVVAARVVDEYRAQADSKGLNLMMDPSGAVPLRSDPSRIGQILGNLISNAIKYTEAGTITLRVAILPDSSGCEHAVVDVSDTGPGIPPQYHRAIFTEFGRVAGAAAPGGAGIGLAISQRIAEALGGRITLDSEPGHGSRFTLWIPFEATPVANPAVEDHEHAVALGAMSAEAAGVRPLS
jgi:signal transduction histidine kinase